MIINLLVSDQSVTIIEITCIKSYNWKSFSEWQHLLDCFYITGIYIEIHTYIYTFFRHK